MLPASGSLPGLPVELCCAPWPYEVGNQVRMLHLLLAKAGFDPGRIEGDLGSQTRVAMIAALASQRRSSRWTSCRRTGGSPLQQGMTLRRDQLSESGLLPYDAGGIPVP